MVFSYFYIYPTRNFFLSFTYTFDISCRPERSRAEKRVFFPTDSAGRRGLMGSISTIWTWDAGAISIRRCLRIGAPCWGSAVISDDWNLVGLFFFGGGLVVESRGVDRLGLMLWIIRLVFDNTSTFLVERYYSELESLLRIGWRAQYRVAVTSHLIIVVYIYELLTCTMVEARDRWQRYWQCGD